jgi:hypothetical protein
MISRALLVPAFEAGSVARLPSGMEYIEKGSDIAEFDSFLPRQEAVKGENDLPASDAWASPLVVAETPPPNWAQSTFPALPPAIPGIRATDTLIPSDTVPVVSLAPAPPPSADPVSAVRLGASPIPASVPPLMPTPPGVSIQDKRSLTDAPPGVTRQGIPAAPASGKATASPQSAIHSFSPPLAPPDVNTPPQKAAGSAGAERVPKRPPPAQTINPPVPLQQAAPPEATPQQRAVLAAAPLPSGPASRIGVEENSLEHSAKAISVATFARPAIDAARLAPDPIAASPAAIGVSMPLTFGSAVQKLSLPVVPEPGSGVPRADVLQETAIVVEAPSSTPSVPVAKDKAAPSASPQPVFAWPSNPEAVAALSPDAHVTIPQNETNFAENTEIAAPAGTATGMQPLAMPAASGDVAVMPTFWSDVADAPLQTQARPAPPPLLPFIVERAQVARDGPVLVTLRPEELGTLRFEIRHTDQGLHLHLSIDQPATLDLLRRHAEQLLQDLRQAGFTGATLSYSDSGAASSGFGGTGGEAPPQKGGSRTGPSSLLTALPADATADRQSRPVAGTLDLRL